MCYFVLVVVATGAGLKDMWSVLVDPSNQQPNPVRSLGSPLGFYLRFCISSLVTVGNLAQESLKGLIGPEGHLVVQALVSHVLAKDSRICSEARHRHADVVVDFE